MIIDMHSRTCRYQSAFQGKRSFFSLVWERGRGFPLTASQQLSLIFLAAFGLCLGLACSACIHARMVAMAAETEQIQKHYIALHKEHVQLFDTKKYLSSSGRIEKIAAARFQLFKPTPEQIQYL